MDRTELENEEDLVAPVVELLRVDVASTPPRIVGTPLVRNTQRRTSSAASRRRTRERSPIAEPGSVDVAELAGPSEARPLLGQLRGIVEVACRPRARVFDLASQRSKRT